MAKLPTSLHKRGLRRVRSNRKPEQRVGKIAPAFVEIFDKEIRAAVAQRSKQEERA